jgi:hypothetical protein
LPKKYDPQISQITQIFSENLRNLRNLRILSSVLARLTGDGVGIQSHPIIDVVAGGHSSINEAVTRRGESE